MHYKHYMYWNLGWLYPTSPWVKDIRAAFFRGAIKTVVRPGTADQCHSPSFADGFARDNAGKLSEKCIFDTRNRCCSYSYPIGRSWTMGNSARNRVEISAMVHDIGICFILTGTAFLIESFRKFWRLVWIVLGGILA